MKKQFLFLFFILFIIGFAIFYQLSSTKNITAIQEAKAYYKESSIQFGESAIDEMTERPDNLVQTDNYMEGNHDSDIYLFCYSNVTNSGNSSTYKLGFIGNNQAYNYCIIESSNGKLSKQKLFNDEMTDYTIETTINNATTEDCIDIIEIQYFDSDNKLKATQRKGIYPNGEPGGLSALDF